MHPTALAMPCIERLITISIADAIRMFPSAAIDEDWVLAMLQEQCIDDDDDPIPEEDWDDHWLEWRWVSVNNETITCTVAFPEMRDGESDHFDLYLNNHLQQWLLSRSDDEWEEDSHYSDSHLISLGKGWYAIKDE